MSAINQKRWRPCTPDSTLTGQLCAELKVPLLTAKILCNREITEPEAAHKFLNPSLDGLHDPFLMADMRSAVDRILRAVEQKERILIYGDYDVDGTTATVI